MLDLNTCDSICLNCVKCYKKKHSISPGSNKKFKIVCNGIPKEYINSDLLRILQEDQSKLAVAMMDPVAWAAQTLDWHCLDPDGSIWKRKNPEEYHKWIAEHPGESIAGRSRYHRPYQAEMLRCGSKRKVFRIGRRAGKTECLVIAALYALFTKPGLAEDQGYKVVVLTPYQSQIETIFKRIEELLLSSADTMNSIRRKVSAPFYSIELHNGSIVKGFTAGTQSGGNANSVRSQDAHMVVFDEADYLKQADIESVLSVTIDHPDATVWMSSTPKGTRGKFFESCYSPLYKEFYFPSYINPMWNAETEAYFRSEFSEMGYKHEIEADFGEQEAGVFQNAYVEAAKASYEYGQIPIKQGWIYGLGVDWNDTAIGTTIAVLAFNPTTNSFFIADRIIIQKEGWTQLSACQKIADLNVFWNPSFIYVDKGFGGMQVEVLKKYGYDAMADTSRGPSHPDSRLKDILKAYDFGGQIEVHDLITKEAIMKAAKPFLVENTVRRFETKSIHFPASDELFIKQLLGYKIDRKTPTGLPVYKADDAKVGDHFLDAVMLALVGFTLEKTPIGKPIVCSDFVFTGKIGENPSQQTSLGGTIVTDPRSIESLNKDNQRPAMNRTDFQNNGNLVSRDKTPGANLNVDLGGVKLWSWPGFGHDAPKPIVKSTEDVIAEARRKMNSPSYNKPRRKMF